MASAMTGEFVKASKREDAPFSMIEQKGLFARLREEIALATGEIARDPRGFIRDLFTDDSRNARRRRRIYIGLSCAVVGHIALFAAMFILDWPQMLTPTEEETKLKVDHMIAVAKADDLPETPQPDVPRGDNGGGGGGGNKSELPASHGRLPEFSSAPPIMTPTTQVPPQIPSLPLPQTIQADPSLQPKIDPSIPIGDPSALPGPPSDGPGTQGGIGSGSGPGVGRGGGPGAGPGEGGNLGKDRAAGSPDGTDRLPTGPIDWNRLREIPGSTQFSWVYRPRPVVTPEAIKNKSVGEVLLRATFNANGTITDISVIRSDVPEMTDSAIQSLAQSKFRPATVKGEPVTVRNVVVRVNITASRQ